MHYAHYLDTPLRYNQSILSLGLLIPCPSGAPQTRSSALTAPVQRNSNNHDARMPPVQGLGQNQSAAAPQRGGQGGDMTDLTQFPELFVRQEIEHLEVFTGFETANRYSIRTPSGEQLLYAFEESSMLGRTLLKKHRPLDIHVIDRNNTNVITASRSFYWFFAHLHVSDGSGQRIGSMQRRFLIPHPPLRPNGRNRQNSCGNARPDISSLHV